MVAIPKGGVPPVNAVFDMSRGNGNAEEQRERSGPQNHAAASRYIMQGKPPEELPVQPQPEKPEDIFAGLPVHPSGTTSELVRLRSIPPAQTPADEAIKQYQANQGMSLKL